MNRRSFIVRTIALAASGLGLVAGLVALVPACTPSTAGTSCADRQMDGDEEGVDCGGSCAPCVTPGGRPAPTGRDAEPAPGAADAQGGAGGCQTTCADGTPCTSDATCASRTCSTAKVCTAARSDDRLENGTETDVDCGGAAAPRCAEGKKCLTDADCNGACSYAGTCVDTPSCKPHLGGDTCGKGEVGLPDAQHESCCRTLPVPGFTDARQPAKKVYLDKYEITTGRVRAFLTAMQVKYGGVPNVRAFIAGSRPSAWDPSWEKFLPADVDNESLVVNRLLLGDRRTDDPTHPPIPPTDEPRKTGTDFQFNGSLFVYLHGNNCSTHTPDSFGFPTWFYPAATLAKYGPSYPPRADGATPDGAAIPASEHLEVKAMNCITNAMLAAFCHWDGGQLATDDVLDFVTASPPSLGNAPGCGTQIGSENPPTTDVSKKGGRCADLDKINAAFDAGGTLPVAGSPLNVSNYMFPYFAEGTFYDKAWEIAAPGRGSLAANGEQVDVVRIKPGDEPWVDLAGNLNESVLAMNGATFSGKFGIRYRGIGYQSARSELNFRNDWEGEGGLRRIERPEAKAGFLGGRCMRFK
jgi:hypothetical protein